MNYLHLDLYMEKVVSAMPDLCDLYASNFDMDIIFDEWLVLG